MKSLKRWVERVRAHCALVDHWMVLHRNHEVWTESRGDPDAFGCSPKKPVGAGYLLCWDSWSPLFSSPRLAQLIGVWENSTKAVIPSPTSSVIQEAGAQVGQKQQGDEEVLPSLLCPSAAGSRLRVARFTLYLNTSGCCARWRSWPRLQLTGSSLYLLVFSHPTKRLACLTPCFPSLVSITCAFVA